jgi:hypothetical protein
MKANHNLPYGKASAASAPVISVGLCAKVVKSKNESKSQQVMMKNAMIDGWPSSQRMKANHNHSPRYAVCKGRQVKE